jgi:hypothetical protein
MAAGFAKWRLISLDTSLMLVYDNVDLEAAEEAEAVVVVEKEEEEEEEEEGVEGSGEGWD